LIRPGSDIRWKSRGVRRAPPAPEGRLAMAKGTRGSVYRRKGSPFWYARVYIDGSPRYKGGFETKTMAQDWIDEEVRKTRKAEILGITPIRDDVTLGAIIPKWLAATKPKVAPSTLESYRSIAESVLLPFLGDRPVSEIRQKDVEDLLATKSHEGKSNATLNRYQTTLSRILTFAVDKGCARENVARQVRRARETPKSFPYLSREDEARLLAAMPDWLRTPCLVALDAGLRAGEIGDLRPRDVDVRRGVIVVRRSKSNKPREVGMTERLKETLRRHLKAIPRGTDHVFHRPDGSRFEKGKYRYDFLHATKAADLDGFRFHDLRHCCGVRLAEAGAPPAVIKAFLGHKSLAATMRYMDHAPLDAARTAASLLDATREPTAQGSREHTGPAEVL